MVKWEGEGCSYVPLWDKLDTCLSKPCKIEHFPVLALFPTRHSLESGTFTSIRVKLRMVLLIRNWDTLLILILFYKKLVKSQIQKRFLKLVLHDAIFLATRLAMAL